MHPSNEATVFRLPKLARKIVREFRRLRARANLTRFPAQPNAPKHALPGELTISLTSYPGRFAILPLTLKSLLDQTVRPDRVVLWIAHEHLDLLPRSILALQNDIFSVRGCEDLRNFKKILPTLGAFPDSFILIADDDTYYPKDWLKSLLDAYDPGQPSIVCHRAHRLAYAPDGSLAPYRTWHYDVSDPQSTVPSTDLLPTGNGGVLYPPRSLPAQTSDLALIRSLSPTSDDVWLFFMWRQNGWRVRRAGGKKRHFVEWARAKSGSLRMLHRDGKKDEHLQTMSRYFGIP